MMTREENQLLTRVGPGAPAGELLRRYWQPAALSAEIPLGGAPLALKLMGEELVLFRDDKGRLGLLGLHCSHRGADLSYGRVEDGGLRCLYHGWLYDVTGRCLEQPAEAAGSRSHENIRHKAYPCQEMGGLVFAYLGPGEPPLLPAYEIFTVDDEHRFACKVFCECSYLQGNEGNIDPVHLSFLHRIFDEDLAATGRPTEYGKVRGSDLSPNILFGEGVAPTVEVEVTDFGLRLATWRASGEKAYLRVSNFVMPNLCAVPGETQGAGYLVNWHVPIDEGHHWKYMVVFSREAPLNKERLGQRYGAGIGRDYRPIRHRSNRYLQDREQMTTKTFSGMGLFFPAHDLFATESQGPIQDRTQEHLVSSDKAIVAARKLLLKAISDLEEGQEPPHVIRDPELNRFPHLVVISEVIPISVNWREYVKRVGAGLGV